MKTLKCAFAGLRLVPFGASMAPQRAPQQQDEIVVSFAPAGSTETMARAVLGFETITVAPAHVAARRSESAERRGAD